ncbi:MAG: hypothetical protein ACLP1Y_14120 [Candidatus Acidiferrales bacterium]
MKLSGAILLALILFFSAAFPAVVQAHWADWGPVYVRLLAAACHRVGSSQRIVQFGTQLYSQAIEVSVFPQCTGIEMTQAYSLLFGVVLLLNWRRMQRPIYFLLYTGGLAGLWAANFCRNVVMGIGRYHPRGWTPVLVFGIFVVAAWPALMRSRT